MRSERHGAVATAGRAQLRRGATLPLAARAIGRALLLGALFAAVPEPAFPAEGPVRVQVVPQEGGWRLLRGGKPYVIKGAGGGGSLELLAASGANSIRTWGADSLGPLLDRAHRLGLTVTVGFWLGHERHGFDYADREQVAAQYERVREGILRHKDHPAVLAWALGNEMEGFADGGNPAIWAAVESLAVLAHRLDPEHPTMTVTADIGGERVQSVHRLCPNIDLMGINSYGGASSLPERYRRAGGTRPYVVTEYGPPGTWEIGRNAWGAVEEWSSTRKADAYSDTYLRLAADSVLCLGSYAFTWGAKQEATATWYGMLLPDGTRLAAADAMAGLWSGRGPTNRCPVIDSLTTGPTGEVPPGARVRVMLAAHDPEGDALTVEWALSADPISYETGGDQRPAPRRYRESIVSAGPTGAELRMPGRPGKYRVSVVVRDGRGGGAVANLPLHVKGAPGSEPIAEVVNLPFVVVGDDAAPAYVPSGWMGDFRSLTMEAGSREQPRSGPSCMKFTYDRPDGWTGVVWQDPPNDWGDHAGGFELSGATRLVFWVRGAVGGERVKFGFGIIPKDKACHDTATAEREVMLTRAWKRVEINLEGRSLRRVKSGFWWTLAGQGAPVSFFLDDVRYE